MYQFELKPFRRSLGPVAEWEKEVERFFNGFSKNEGNFAPLCEILDQEKPTTT
jgi:hypothetical protein